MIPIRDHNPSQSRPVVTIALILANIAMFLLTLPATEAATRLWEDLALYPVAVMHGELLWGLLTHMFLHAGVLHLAGNMLFLWIFGDNLEDQFGRAGFLCFYLACGLAAAAAQIAAQPDAGVPMVGASGAIAGVMGGYLLLFPRARVDVLIIVVVLVRVITLPAWLVLVAWFLLQLVAGYAMSEAGDGVAYWAHAGGFAAGVALTLARFLWLGGPDYWNRTHGHPPHPPTRFAPSRIPPVRRQDGRR